MDAAAVACNPAHESVHHHARNKRSDQATKEKVASALTEDGNGAERGEQDAGDGNCIHED